MTVTGRISRPPSGGRIQPVEGSLRAALDVVDEAVLICDRELHVVWGNRSALRHVGSRLDAPDRLLPEVCPEWAAAVILDEALPLLATGQAGTSWRGDSALCRFDGGETPMSLRLQSIAGGLLVAAFRSRVEATDTTPVGGVAAMVAEITHELRTPLTGVLGMAELLRETDLAPEQRELMEALHHSATHLRGLVDGLLELSRLEAGRVELVTAEWRPKQLLGELDAEFTPRFRAKGLTLATALDHAVPRKLVGDVFRLRQVLTNLLANALKFSARGTVRLAVDRDQDQLRFQVIDQGIGIAPEALSRLFTPFRQADPAVARQYGGSGLGLAICKRLVELMGGAISVDSAPGRGSIFTVRIPLQAG